jgi:hypothetical protein
MDYFNTPGNITPVIKRIAEIDPVTKKFIRKIKKDEKGNVLYNYKYSENDVTKKIQYYIYKDTDSLFYAGIGGGSALIVTDNTTSDTKTIIVPGSEINYITDTDLRFIDPNP